MAYGQNKWNFKTVFWLLSTIFFWFIIKHIFYLGRYCVLPCFLFYNGKWKVIVEYWKFGEIKNQDIYPCYFYFCTRELPEAGKTGNFFALRDFLIFFFCFIKSRKSLQTDPIGWHYAFRKCIQILNPDLKEIPE